MIHPDLQRYLDGEIPRDALPPELSQETGEWEALLASAAELRAERAPAWLEGRVMSTLSTQPAPSLWRTAWGWLLHPQPVRLRPIGVMLAGAAALLLFWIWPGARPPLPGVGAAGPGAAAQFTGGAVPVVYVQFVFAAESATSVAVAGDFNGWQSAGYPLSDADGDGVWTGLFALQPGLHKYMFLVDGARWLTDPRAERYVDDGFGMRNALIAVAPPTGRAS